MASATLPPETGEPSRLGLAWFATRIFLLRGRRSVSNLIHPIPKLASAPAEGFLTRLALHRSPLKVAGSKERGLELGKIQNLRVAARALDGLEIPRGVPFSFWRHIGRCTKGKGYVPGRQLQEGCLVPVVGGGICQLSNALYDVALKAGCEILERHPHTRIIPGSAASQDRDATVAWNHVDLRWRSESPMRLTVRLTANSLEVGLWSSEPAAKPEKKAPTPLRQALDPAAHSCGMCERPGCVLFAAGVVKDAERTAFLVDEVWPEFDGYLQGIRGEGDVLFVPLKGRPNYAWNEAGFAEVSDARQSTLRRSVRSRRLAHQGAERQLARLRSSSELAESYGTRLKPDVTHLVVALDLLPHLWLRGYLGGRTFDVLMTRFPMAELQDRLDRSYKNHSDRGLLADFRAPAQIVKAESEALLAARQIITPHRAIGHGDSRRVLLDWTIPTALPWSPGEIMIFPGPTVARKGAYEVREAARQLGVTVSPLGRDLEGQGFWDSIPLTPAEENWLSGAKAVIQPAILEDRPKRLLRATASGCPVIVTEACGLTPGPLVHIVPEGDVDAIVTAWRAINHTNLPERIDPEYQ